MQVKLCDRIRGSYDDALYKSTYTLLYFTSHTHTRWTSCSTWTTKVTGNNKWCKFLRDAEDEIHLILVGDADKVGAHRPTPLSRL